jgi:pSer/pThr/pTyr-binding forkhead associated (FHA) protein
VNGTFVGEHRITHHTLHDGDVIRIGTHEMIFRLIEVVPAVPAVMPGVEAGGELAPVIEPQPFTQQDWLQDQVAAMGAQDETRRKVVGWVLNGAIVAGIIVVVVVIMMLRGPGNDAVGMGTVTLEMGYPQILRVPERPAALDVTVSPSDLVQFSFDPEDARIKDLWIADPYFYFVIATPSNTGEGTIRCAGGKEYTINVIVNAQQKAGPKAYAQEYANAKTATDEVKAAKAREWARNASDIARTQPAVAFSMVDVADAYADRALARELDLEGIREKAKKALDQQWRGLCLKCNQVVKQADLDKKAQVLREMLQLIPDERDLRHQWAQLNLQATEFSIVKRRRTTSPWGG